MENCLSKPRRYFHLGILAITVGMFFMLPSGAVAQSGRAGGFLRIGLGARAKAMGNAFTALAGGLEASHYNPAGLPFLEHRAFMASYRALSLDRQFTFIGFGLPIHPKVEGHGGKAFNGGLALTWIRAAVTDIDGRDTSGQHTDNLSNSENAFALTFALNPVEKISVGLSVKILWNRFPDVGVNGQTISASGVGLDFGVLIRPVEWLSFGAVVRDLNARYRWSTDDLFGEDGSETVNKFPKSFRTAVAVTLPQLQWLTFAVDYDQFYKEKLFSARINDRIHLGAEADVYRQVKARAGVDDGSVTLGGGYQFDLLGKMSQLNYAFVSSGNRPEAEHVFTWIFQF